MLNPEIELSSPNSKRTAVYPAARKARVERKDAVDERHYCVDVLAEICQRNRGKRLDARVLAGTFQCPPGVIDASATVLLPVFGPTVNFEEIVAKRSHCQGGSIMGISIYCLFEEVECPAKGCYRAGELRERAQIKIVGGRIARRALG